MRVILLQDVPKLGMKNEVKDVSDGYARNFLFAKNLAKPATVEALKTLSVKKDKEEREKSEEYLRYKAVVEKLKSLELKFKVKIVARTGKAGRHPGPEGLGREKGRAFGSVTPAKIKEALAKHGISVGKESILLDDSIKATGERVVKIKLPNDLIGEVKVLVESETKI